MKKYQNHELTTKTGKLVKKNKQTLEKISILEEQINVLHQTVGIQTCTTTIMREQNTNHPASMRFKKY